MGLCRPTESDDKDKRSAADAIERGVQGNDDKALEKLLDEINRELHPGRCLRPSDVEKDLSPLARSRVGTTVEEPNNLIITNPYRGM